MENSKTKRPRPVLSCYQCRDRKLKCNRSKPCEQCVKAARPSECTFSTEQEPLVTKATTSTVQRSPQMARPTPVRSADAFFATSTTATTHADQNAENSEIESLPRKRSRLASPVEKFERRNKDNNGIGVIEDLQLRVKALEHRLSGQKASLEGFNVAKKLNGPALPKPGSKTKPLMTLDVDGYRFRYRGQHHRATILKLFGEVRPFVHEALRDPKVGSIIKDASGMQKSYAKRYNSYSAQPVPDVSSAVTQMIDLLPTRFVCDILVDMYLTHWEKTLRVLHVPSFRQEYTAFWEQDYQLTNLSPGFIPQLIAILVIAYRIHSDSEAFLERGFAYTCYAMLKAWQNQLVGRERSYFSNLQAATLLVIAGQMIPQSLDKMWTETGALVRHAMTLGLHVEPDGYARVNVFHGEIRRRLWATILELDIQSSLLAGMPTTIRFPDYNCRCPSNIDDRDLNERMATLPNAQRLEVWTDTLPQIFLANSASWRLRAAEEVSRQRSGGHGGEIPRIASKLIEASEDRNVCLKLETESLTRLKNPERLASLVLLELFSRRALISLYRPTVLDNGWSAEMAARRHFVTSSLQILEYQDALDPEIKDVDSINTKPCWALLQNLWKHDIVQAALGICFEIKCMQDSLSHADGKDASAFWVHTISGDVDAALQPSTLKSKAFLIRIVKNTVDLLVRGIADHGNDIKDILMLSVVLQYVKTCGTDADKHAAMMNDLVHVIDNCRQRLLTDKGPIETTEGAFEVSLHNLPSVPIRTSSDPPAGSADYERGLDVDFSGLEGFFSFDDLDFNFSSQW